MRFGIRLPQGKDRYSDAIHTAVRAEDLGYDSVWLGEHHLIDGPYWPSPQLALAGISQRTNRLTLGTAVFLLPLANPVRVAGELSLLSQMNRDDIVLGVSTGWREREFSAMGVSPKMRGRRMVEYVEAIRELWENDIGSYDGEYVSFQEVMLSPRPVDRSRLDIWVGGNSEGAFEAVADVADRWLPERSISFQRFLNNKATIEEKLAERDRTFDDWILDRDVLIAESHDAARRKAREYLDAVYELHRDEGNPSVVAQTSDSVDEYIDEQMIVGTPAEVTSQLEEVRDPDVGKLILSMWYPGMSRSVLKRDLELFADEVAPHLDG